MMRGGAGKFSKDETDKKGSPFKTQFSSRASESPVLRASGGPPCSGAAQQYICEYNCGFKGSFEVVQKHEIACAIRTVRNMHPDLTSGKALIGARNMDSAINVPLKCAEHKSAESNLKLHEPPAIETLQSPASVLGHSQEHEKDGRKVDLIKSEDGEGGVTVRGPVIVDAPNLIQRILSAKELAEAGEHRAADCTRKVLYYGCEFECGFIGGFEVVLEHEKTCKLRDSQTCGIPDNEWRDSPMSVSSAEVAVGESKFHVSEQLQEGLA